MPQRPDDERDGEGPDRAFGAAGRPGLPHLGGEPGEHRDAADGEREDERDPVRIDAEPAQRPEQR